MTLHLNFIQSYSIKIVKPSFSIFLSRNYFELKETSCYDDWNIFLHFVSISVVQWKYPSGQSLCSFLKVFRKKSINYVSQLFSGIGSINHLNANPTKWSNPLKQFVGNFPSNCLSVFDHFVKLALKGLKKEWIKENIQPTWKFLFLMATINRLYSTKMKIYHQRKL